MNTSRRSFVKASGLAALLVGSGSLAGCTDSITGGGGDSSRSWLYDPAELGADVENEGFATVDLATVLDDREHFPDSFFDELEEADDEVDSVDLMDLERAAGVGFANEDDEVGVVVAVEGSFDPDEFESELREEADDDEFESLGEYEGFQLFGADEETLDGEPQSGAIAVSDDAIVMGFTERTEITAEEAVEAAIDANAGDLESYADASDNVATIEDEVGDATITVGVDFDQDLASEQTPDGQEDIQTVIDGMDAVGYGVTLDGDVAENTLVLVYDSADAASADAVESLINMAEQEGLELLEYVDDISVSEDGRAVVLSAEVETAGLWEDAGYPLGVSSDAATAGAEVRDA